MRDARTFRSGCINDCHRIIPIFRSFGTGYRFPSSIESKEFGTFLRTDTPGENRREQEKAIHRMLPVQFHHGRKKYPLAILSSNGGCSSPPLVCFHCTGCSKGKDCSLSAGTVPSGPSNLLSIPKRSDRRAMKGIVVGGREERKERWMKWSSSTRVINTEQDTPRGMHSAPNSGIE